MTGRWQRGNAQEDGAGTRGWLVGHFLDAAELRHSGEVEIKWLTHPAGDRREAPVTTETRTTVVLLVSGRFTIELGGERVRLTRPGDYLMWGPGVGHDWVAEIESTLVTIRWPSRSS